MMTSDYTEPFELVHVSYETDGKGDQRPVREAVFGGFAKVVNLTGQEYWEACAQGQKTPIKAHTRWAPPLENIDTRGLLLVMRGHDFDVTSVENVAWRNEHCTIRAEEVRHG